MNQEQLKEFLNESIVKQAQQPRKTTVWICEHPYATAGIALGGAALVGGVIGFLIGRATAN